MKKLIMAATVVFAAIGLNAATVNWQATKGYIYDGAAGNKLSSGTAYLMYVTDSFSQSDLVTAFATAEGKADATVAAMTASGAMATGTGAVGSNGRIPFGTTSTYDTTADGTAYFVIFNDDKMYVSVTGDALYDAVTGEASVAFASVSASSKLDFQAADGYSAAGWYAVPEPTSGLLMLLGMAGLALRRKRA